MHPGENSIAATTSGYVESFYCDGVTINPAISMADEHDGLPLEGEPGSVKQRKRGNTVIQERKYGPDGLPEVDTDYEHGGVGHTFPHQHVWKGKKRGQAQPMPPREPEPQNIIIAPNPIGIEALEAITGLTGSALLIYIVISEGSRLLVPVRNLVPVP